MNGKTYSFHALCETLGKGQLYVKNLLRQVSLPVLSKGQRYSESYCRLLRKVIALRTFSVSLEQITELIGKEKKLLRMLHFDALGEGPTWWLDACSPELSDRCLMLSGVDLGFPLRSEHVQHTLDFGERDPELFKSAEMGENLRVVLDRYLELLDGVTEKVRLENAVLRDALRWSRLWDEAGITRGAGAPAMVEEPVEESSPGT